MKVSRPHTIGFFDVDHSFRLTFQAAARFFQDMATLHSQKVGAGFRQLQKKGVIWFLNRLEIEMVSCPHLFDEVSLLTWSRKIKGVKGLREYLIQSPGGEPLVKGTSVWLFYDVKQKRIAKVPPDISECYQPEEERLFLDELDQWHADADFDPEQQIDISLRYADFDINGHVNNTVYVGFLESLYHSGPDASQEPVRNIKIKFDREIDRKNTRVCTGWKKSGGAYACRIFNGKTTFAAGQITPGSATAPQPVGK